MAPSSAGCSRASARWTSSWKRSRSVTSSQPLPTVPSGAKLARGGEAIEELAVGHGRDIADVRLRRAVERLDDLVAPAGHGVGVAGHLVEQAAGAGRGIVDLVD